MSGVYIIMPIPCDIRLYPLPRSAEEVCGYPQRKIAKTAAVPLPLYLSDREFFCLAPPLCSTKTSPVRLQDSTTAEILKHGELYLKQTCT